MKKFLTYLSRHLHLLFWRITGKTEHYVKVQIASSHNTRDNLTVQENIQFALKSFFVKIPTKEAKILDAGCGDGWTMDQMRNAGYANIWGIDINEDKLAIAQKHNHKNVAKMLLPEMDFSDDTFDAIFCRHVYEHLLYPEKTLAAFYRILKPGGTLFLIAPKSEITADSNESHTVKIMTVDDILDLVKNVNFTEIQHEEHFLEELEFWVIAKKKI